MPFMISDNLISANFYNSLPHIGQVSSAVVEESSAIEHLRELLYKHSVPAGVTIRLIHKHYDASNGEVMVFDTVSVPKYGTAKVLKPVVPVEKARLRGVNFVVTQEGLQAYEYTSTVGNPVDMSEHQSFLDEFCDYVLENHLEHVFGLRLVADDTLDKISWTEYELEDKRSTIMLQENMPMLEANFDYTTNTEWGAGTPVTVACSHSTCKHCRHGNQRCSDEIDREDLYLAGHRLVEGTPIHELINSIAIMAF